MFIYNETRNTMKRQLTHIELAQLKRRERSDKGKHHKPTKHGNFRVGQYGLSGRLEAEYESLQDAVDNNTVGATYVGILACVTGRVRRHCKKIWRKEVLE